MNRTMWIGANGKQQEVYLGQLQNGMFGLFTGGYLVLPLGATATEDEAEAEAQKMGFKFIRKGER